MVAFATQVKRRRGTAAQNNEFTGAEGEIVVNLTDKSLRVHDGRTKGGFETLRQNMQNSVNITNCPIEIPQDIKLELNNGVLTIKAGSKVYYPNGVGVFNEVVLTADITYTDATKTGQWFVCLSRSLAGTVGSIANSVSGTSQPTVGFSLWYNTEENIMYRYGNINDAPASGVSLPIAIVTLNNTGVVSIDQVFNGRGEIGSTIFALPGLKGVIPNGTNEDGTLKNTIVTLSAVTTISKSGTFSDNNVYIAVTGRLYSINSTFFYDKNTNFIRNTGDNTPFGVFSIGTANSVNNVISFNPKTVFHAVDHNDLKNMSFPTGIVAPFANTTAPTGWLKCDGSAVSRTRYADLFAAIGIMYGAGDGSTTFNLPNLIGYLPLGMTSNYVGKTTNGALPNILGTFTVGAIGDASDYTGGIFNTGGAFSSDLQSSNNSLGGGSVYTSNRRATFDAARYNEIYSSSNWFSGTRVIPASVGMTYCIKY